MVRVAILGLGRIGHGFGLSADGDPLSHSAAYRIHPNVEIAFCIDPKLWARTRLTNQFPEVAVFESVEDVDVETAVNLVSICSPTECHKSDLEIALKLGAKAILCEKPLAPTIADARAMVQSCKAANCQLIVNYRRRWAPMFAVLKRLTGPGGKIGTVLGASMRYDGGLMHNGTHYIDLVTGLFGDPDKISLVKSVEGKKADSCDTVLIEWTNGLTVHLISVVGSGAAVAEGEIWGTDGIVRFSRAGRIVTWQTLEPSEWTGFKEWGRSRIACRTGLKGCISAAISEAVHLAQHGGMPTCSGENCLRTMELVYQARGIEMV